MQFPTHLVPLRRYCIWVIVIATISGKDAFAEEKQPRPAFDSAVGPLLEQYCSDCHSAETAVGNAISFAPFLESPDFQKDREFWQKASLRLHTGEMPPPDAEKPAPEERAALVKWLREELDTFSCDGPRDPGPAVLRRLNRIQYRNTIRDWLGVDFDVATIFPPDDLAHGFDNSGDALAMTTLQVEKYLTAAELIANQAIVAPESITSPRTRIRSRDLKGGEELDDRGRVMFTAGVIVANFEAPREGSYLLRARVSADQAGAEPARMAFASHDGKKLKEFDVVADRSEDDAQLAVLPLDLKKGRHRAGLAFLNDYYDEGNPDSEQRDRNLYIHRVELVGPLDEERPESHSKLIDREPSADEWRDGKAWAPVVDAVLNRWLRMAFRRQVKDDEVTRLRAVVAEARHTGATFERAMQVALQAILVSPQFLFIAPPDASGPADGEPFVAKPIDEFALASRLSYFLWSTIPDRRLLQLAEQGKLRQQLDSEVKRMLTDERIGELARNFGGSWLQTRELANVEPDTEQFKDFNDDLRTAMEREVELFFTEIIQRNRSVIDLLSADYTFVNEQLAKHYGIDKVSGDEFRRVKLSDPRRGGVLTMAAVLTVTSNPDRTSPVKRGKWLLGQMLGDEPPPPPPNIPDLAESKKDDRETLREMLARHRADSACAVCHQRMDPMGLALENYDAIGRWRDREGEQSIDASGELPDGRKFAGAAGLRELMLAELPMFRRNLAQQMLTYAIGRGLTSADACTTSDIVNHMQEEDDKFSALVLGIVQSAPFQQQRIVKQAKE